jgi:hypothetical protein
VFIFLGLRIISNQNLLQKKPIIYKIGRNGKKPEVKNLKFQTEITIRNKQNLQKQKNTTLHTSMCYFLTKLPLLILV